MLYHSHSYFSKQTIIIPISQRICDLPKDSQASIGPIAKHASVKTRMSLPSSDLQSKTIKSASKVNSSIAYALVGPINNECLLKRIDIINILRGVFITCKLGLGGFFSFAVPSLAVCSMQRKTNEPTYPCCKEEWVGGRVICKLLVQTPSRVPKTLMLESSVILQQYQLN